MKRIFVTILFLILMLTSTEAFATKLPENEIKALKQTFKDMKVRFDGLVELSDGTQYIPVFPLQDKKQNPTKVIMTIPSNKPLKQKPDFFMFNTNMAFFKIIKKADNKTSVIYTDAIPMDVKMGLLPQDLLVPTGFEMPGELRIIIGDLVIPVLPNKEFKEVNLATGKEITDSPRTQLVAQAAQQVANKYFYSTSFNQNAVTVLNADNGKAFKQILFSSIPSDIKLTPDGRYLLVSTIKNGNVFIVDKSKAKVLKEIKAGLKPATITMSDAENLAYVANRGSNTITVIDLGSMEVKETIPVTGNPSYVTIADDGLTIYYLDAIAGIVYKLTRADNELNPYIIKPLFRTNNISKIQYLNDKLYTLDRGKNELDIFYIKGKPQKEGLVHEYDITPVEEVPAEEVKAEATEDTTQETVAVNADENSAEIQPAVDYTDEKPFEENTEKSKKTFKEKVHKISRAILYYQDDDVPEKQVLNPENQVEVLSKNTEEYEAEEKPAEEKTVWKKAKENFLNYMQYTPDETPITPIESIKLSVEKQMDFINIPARANDFVIAHNKLYLLCADTYSILVYDINTIKQIDTIKLDEVGYYNSIKISKDNTTGILTNITSKELVLFSTETDKVIQKLPVSVNVHNIVITGKK